MRFDRRTTALAGVLAALAIASTPVIAQSLNVGGVSVGNNGGGGASVSVGTGSGGGANVGVGGSNGTGVSVGGSSANGNASNNTGVNVGGVNVGGTGGILGSGNATGNSNALVNVGPSGNGTVATVDLNGDGIVNGADNDLLILDTDGNGILTIGDDVNGDGILSGLDLGNANATPLTVNLDGDSGSVVNVDRSGNGTAATVDLNGDGVINGADNNLLVLDTDGNGILNIGDDVNGDGILSGLDLGNANATPLTVDLNGDTDSVVSVDRSGNGTAATVDLNGDGVINGADNDLLVLDTDGNGVLNIGDDVNGDGVLSSLDLGDTDATPLVVNLGGNGDNLVDVDGSGDGTEATVNLNGVEVLSRSANPNGGATVDLGESGDSNSNAVVSIGGVDGMDGSAASINLGTGKDNTGDADGGATIGGFAANEPIIQGIGTDGVKAPEISSGNLPVVGDLGDAAGLDGVKLPEVPTGSLPAVGDLGNGAAGNVLASNEPEDAAAEPDDGGNAIGSLASLSPSQLRDTLGSLDDHEKVTLKKSCRTIMAAPQRYSAATRAVCQVIGSL